MQETNDDTNRTVYIPFNTMSDLKDTHYLDGIWIGYHGDYQKIEKTIRETLAAAHNFKSTDHDAMHIFNLMTQLHQFEILSIALQVLLSLVGAFTLGIAGVGLMNIMLVAVQQRTREIGIEKALGARKRHILVQFLAEAMAITGVGGICGIALAYLISIMVGRITFYSAIAKYASSADIRLIISPSSIIVATAILDCYRPGQRHDPRHSRRQPRPHRGPPLRVKCANRNWLRKWSSKAHCFTAQ